MSVISSNAAHVNPYKMSQCGTQLFCFLCASEHVTVRDRTPAAMAKISESDTLCPWTIAQARVIAIMASILSARRLAQHDGGKRITCDDMRHRGCHTLSRENYEGN